MLDGMDGVLEAEGMKLYTAGGSIANRRDCKELGVGLMMCDGWRDPSEYPYFAVDNGAFSAWTQNKTWNSATFVHILNRCEEERCMPDFAVLPDIVGGGVLSLERSRRWLRLLREEYPGISWALAVQDGMEPFDSSLLTGMGGVRTIFVGGTMKWKLKTMGQWAAFAHENGLSCHVGRIGTVDNMVMADVLGADSIDSTTWVQRNGCLRDHVEAYRAFMAMRKPLEEFA